MAENRREDIEKKWEREGEDIVKKIGCICICEEKAVILCGE